MRFHPATHPWGIECGASRLEAKNDKTSIRHRPHKYQWQLTARPIEETQPHRSNPIKTTLNALRGGLRSQDFGLLSGSFFVCGASTNGLIGTHLIPACIDQCQAAKGSQ